MVDIAHSELIQILRNRAVLIASLIMPVGACIFFIYYREQFAAIGSLGYIGAVIVFTIAAFSLSATTVTTLAARRQTLFLKRLRSTAAGDATILTGLVLPVVAIAVIQVSAILLAFAVVGSTPADPIVLAGAVLATMLMMLALGVATAGITTSPEHAQVTTLPISLGVIAVANWVGIAGTENFTVLKRLLPGGAATELITGAWDGGMALREALFLLAPTLAWVAVAIALASQLFRWEPRH